MPSGPKTERTAFLVLFGLLALLGLYVIYPFLKTVLLSIVLTVLFFPLNEWILKRFKRPNLAAALSVIAIILFIFVPLAILASLVGRQVGSLLENAPNELLSSWYVSLQIWVTKIEDMLGVQFNLLEYYQKGLKWLGTSLAGITSGLVVETAHFIFHFFILSIVSFYLFRDGRRFFEVMIHLVPVKDQYERSLAHEMQNTIHGVFYGSFLTALLQAILATLGYWIAGVPGYLVWGCITFFVAFIPMIGTGAAVIPLVIMLFAQGKTGSAIFLSLYAAGIIGLVDNIVKPLLIRSNMHPLIIFLSLFGGIAVFGPTGLLLGPIILSLLTATVKMYSRDFTGVKLESITPAKKEKDAKD